MYIHVDVKIRALLNRIAPAIFDRSMEKYRFIILFSLFCLFVNK